MMSGPASHDTGVTPRIQQPLQRHSGGGGAPRGAVHTPSASAGPVRSGSMTVGATPGAAHATPRRRDLGVGTLHYWNGPHTPGHTATGSGSRLSGDVRSELTVALPLLLLRRCLGSA